MRDKKLRGIKKKGILKQLSEEMMETSKNEVGYCDSDDDDSEEEDENDTADIRYSEKTAAIAEINSREERLSSIGIEMPDRAEMSMTGTFSFLKGIRKNYSYSLHISCFLYDFDFSIIF